MQLPDLPDFPHRSFPHGRIYRVHPAVDLVVVHVEAPLPAAPAGSFVYAFALDRRVGDWQWTDSAVSLEQIMRTFRDTTSPDYEPPEQLAPGGEPAQIRAPIQRSLERLIEESRPGFNAFRGFIDEARWVIPINEEG